ncbi:preprotein translocase subunit SecA [Escherichia coli]|nr:preprotein translocase subunit SecA [Escherichia coli]
MLIKLLTKVFGSRNDRTLRRMRKVVNIINAMEPEMEKTLRRRTEREKPQSFVHVWKKAKCWKI